MNRTVWVIIWTICATILLGIPVIVIAAFEKNSGPLHKIAGIWARSILLAGGVNVKFRGLNHFDRDKPHVFMANHQSNFDIPVLLGCLPVQFRWLAKKELFKIPLFGLAMKKVDYISIDRSNQESAKQSLKAAAKLVHDGASVMIFPEGTRSMDGHIQPFKKGGFHLAMDAEVPIVPIIIHGTRPIMPKKELKIISGDVLVQALPPVSTTGYTAENKDELIFKVRSIIRSSFDRLKKERE